MSGLPADLIEKIEERIAEPTRRHDSFGGVAGETLSDPAAVFAVLENQNPELGRTPFRDVVAQMNAWGQQMPSMHITRYPDGGVGAFSENPLTQPLARPASPAHIARVEALIGRELPADLRALYAIADGGWGPGIAHTGGHGTGFQSLTAVAATLEDLRRRGPGYTAEADWPAHLLPIADTVGPASYNLDTGEIVAFNDNYFNDGQTIDEAFRVTHPNLEAWLREWVSS